MRTQKLSKKREQKLSKKEAANRDTPPPFNPGDLVRVKPTSIFARYGEQGIVSGNSKDSDCILNHAFVEVCGTPCVVDNEDLELIEAQVIPLKYLKILFGNRKSMFFRGY